MNLSEAARAYEIRSVQSVFQWLRKFGSEMPISMSTNQSDDPEELKKKIKLLEQELYMEKIRTEGLNIMIDLAEKRENISIRKKDSTKQSKK
jgi:transposase-like protein